MIAVVLVVPAPATAPDTGMAMGNKPPLPEDDGEVLATSGLRPLPLLLIVVNGLDGNVA